MRKSKSETFGVRNKNDALGGKRFKLYHFLLGVGILYLVFIYFKFPQFLEIASAVSGDDSFVGLDRPDKGNSLFGSPYEDTFHRHLEDSRNQNAHALLVSGKESLGEEFSSSPPIKPLQHRYGRITGEIMRHRNRTSGLSELEKVADEAWTLGLKAWGEVENYGFKEINQTQLSEGTPESCPTSISMSGDELAKTDNLMFLPCGLAAGSSITVVGTPHKAHKEYVPQLARLRHGDSTVWVSQFNVELQGLRTVDGEDPPRILHLNPRLKGDWSQKPIIEHNTCYRMQWGKAQRCDGIPSKNDDDTGNS